MRSVPNQLSLRLGIKPFRDAVRFGGRSTRTELISFWLLYMAAILIFVAIALTLTGLEVDRRVERVVSSAFMIAFWLPTPALISRRLHDINWPGWPGALFVAAYAAVACVGQIADPFYRFPLVVSIPVNLAALVLFIASLWHETPGTNRYGPDPRLAPEDASLVTQ